MEEILAADPQTAKELLYDIRQAAAGQRSAAAAAALARSGRAAAAWCRGADPGTALRLAHSTPGVPMRSSCDGVTSSKHACQQQTRHIGMAMCGA